MCQRTCSAMRWSYASSSGLRYCESESQAGSGAPSGSACAAATATQTSSAHIPSVSRCSRLFPLSLALTSRKLRPPCEAAAPSAVEWLWPSVLCARANSSVNRRTWSLRNPFSVRSSACESAVPPPLKLINSGPQSAERLMVDWDRCGGLVSCTAYPHRIHELCTSPHGPTPSKC